jgi:hypothetical protein
MSFKKGLNTYLDSDKKKILVLRSMNTQELPVQIAKRFFTVDQKGGVHGQLSKAQADILNKSKIGG